MTLLRAKLSMQAVGLYMIIVPGLGLMVLPHVILGLFGLSAGDDAWIRMVGLLAAIIGVYYLVAAGSGFRPLYRFSVALRLFAAAFMAGLFLTGTLGAGFLLFAAIDALGAVWTWAALRADTAPAA